MAYIKFVERTFPYKYKDSSTYEDLLCYCGNPEKAVAAGTLHLESLTTAAAEMQCTAQQFHKDYGTRIQHISCTYCYEYHKSNRRMSVETAKSIVDYELKNFADFEGIEFDLFGGEPFLAFDLVREITDYICSKKGDIPCTVFATTNGTLVHGEVQDWLREHVGCFICGLSLDGTRDIWMKSLWLGVFCLS